eukprot:COSAG05_NODE_881_length_6789_cov_21.387743_7_plen_51_part_00
MEMQSVEQTFAIERLTAESATLRKALESQTERANAAGQVSQPCVVLDLSM